MNEYYRKLCGYNCNYCKKRRAKGDCHDMLCRKCCYIICLTEPYGKLDSKNLKDLK